MSNITNKNQATSYLNANITNDVGTEPFLNPTPTYAIKSGNLKYYLNRFIEWIFPGTPTDVRGKVLGIPHSNTPNTDYSGLSWLTMMPLGGITMYAVNGRNNFGNSRWCPNLNESLKKFFMGEWIQKYNSDTKLYDKVDRTEIFNEEAFKRFLDSTNRMSVNQLYKN